VPFTPKDFRIMRRAGYVLYLLSFVWPWPFYGVVMAIWPFVAVFSSIFDKRPLIQFDHDARGVFFFLVLLLGGLTNPTFIATLLLAWSGAEREFRIFRAITICLIPFAFVDSLALGDPSNVMYPLFLAWAVGMFLILISYRPPFKPPTLKWGKEAEK
jgi:hypothetical protein